MAIKANNPGITKDAPDRSISIMAPPEQHYRAKHGALGMSGTLRKSTQ